MPTPAKKRETKKQRASRLAAKPRKPDAVDIPAKKTQRERVHDFVAAYKKTGDLSEAITTSGLSRGHAVDLVASHPELREDISSILVRCGVTPDLIAQELRRIATFNPKDMLDENGLMRPMHQWPDDLARAVQGMDVSRREYKDDSVEVTHKPRFADKLGPLRELAKMSAMASDRLEIANPKGEKFTINNDGPTETRDQIIASLLSMVAPKKDPPAADAKSKSSKKP